MSVDLEWTVSILAACAVVLTGVVRGILWLAGRREDRLRQENLTITRRYQ